MPRKSIFDMRFSAVYPALLQKAVGKGRREDEVHALTRWLTGYTQEAIDEGMLSELSYGDFFRNAPAIPPNAVHITGRVCGLRVETIEDPLMQRIRWLDKLVDELAKGKPMEKILR